MAYAIAVFLVFFILAGSGLVLLFYREAVGERLARALAPHGGAGIPQHTGLQRFAESVGLVAGSLQKVVPRSEAEASAVQKRLVRAGLRDTSAPGVFYAAKAVLPIALCVIATATGVYRLNAFIVFALALVLGYLVPDFVLDHLIRKREDEIRRSLPDILDLLVVCLEAGLSLDQAVIRTVDEMRPSHPGICDELGLVMLEVRAGKPRAAAWRALGDRSEVEFIHLLISILVQTDQFGTGISKTLRAHSDSIRTRRTQQVEELAAKTTIKLVFPLAPALILLMEGLTL
jgi:tight adherence protein C